jgi:hypothetical protein
MADPFSIAAATAGLIDITFRLSIAIHEFRKEVQGVDDDLQTLADEVENLASLCRGIESIYRVETSRSPGSPPKCSEASSAPDHTNFRTHLRSALRNCSDTLCKIEEIITRIRGDSSSSTKFDAIIKTVRKRLKGADLRHHRAQLAAHQKVLQIVLTIITKQVVPVLPRTGRAAELSFIA